MYDLKISHCLSTPFHACCESVRALTDAKDGSAKYITNAASSVGGATDMCKENLLASWSLTMDIGKTAAGREAISTAFNTCKPLTTTYAVEALLDFAQAPW